MNNSDVVYIFIDEAGDMDFSANGSKYYMFNFLVKQRPFRDRVGDKRVHMHSVAGLTHSDFRL